MGNLRDTWNKGKQDDGGPPATERQRRFLSSLFNKALERGVITEDQYELAMKVVSVIRVGPASEIITELVGIKDRGWIGKAVRLARTLKQSGGQEVDDESEPESEPESETDEYPYYEVHLGNERFGLVSHGLTEQDARDLCDTLHADPDFAEWEFSIWQCNGSVRTRTALIAGLEG